MEIETRVVETRLKNGASLRVLARALEGNEHIDYSYETPSFEVLTETIENIADSITDTVKKVDASRTQIEFGLEFALEANQLMVMLVPDNHHANVKVSLEWDSHHLNADHAAVSSQVAQPENKRSDIPTTPSIDESQPTDSMAVIKPGAKK
ncbi:hypothetical protein KDH_63970 [Dictyobacter sp. S3.2.2.5]|uniref:Trypsin-co-occurring domain-containing protein n=1 Tax=Dictyobacter halimunensis TaxID=3026934 RepID=A0ABQ6G446_9CHLR|nr:hypothetical protein KDH_63970 [Dictyobacter sp. S3.2.2.5]